MKALLKKKGDMIKISQIRSRITWHTEDFKTKCFHITISCTLSWIDSKKLHPFYTFYQNTELSCSNLTLC